jgi:hypothetical protein
MGTVRSSGMTGWGREMLVVSWYVAGLTHSKSSSLVPDGKTALGVELLVNWGGGTCNLGVLLDGIFVGFSYVCFQSVTTAYPVIVMRVA